MSYYLRPSFCIKKTKQLLLMKKISLFALALGTSLAMFAQNQPTLTTPMTKAVRFGIKAGVNLATMRADNISPEPDFNTKTSFNAGFLVNVPFGTSNFALQPELLYSGQGTKIKETTGVISPTTNSYEQDLSYLTLPIMVQWKSTGGFFVETGPQPGLLIRAKSDATGSNVDNKDQFDKFDLEWGLGLGYLSRIGLGIGARYNYGLTNTLKESSSNSSDNGPDLKHNVIQIGLSWQFGAGK
jgi:hypothetical protein